MANPSKYNQNTFAVSPSKKHHRFGKRSRAVPNNQRSHGRRSGDFEINTPNQKGQKTMLPDDIYNTLQETTARALAIEKMRIANQNMLQQADKADIPGLIDAMVDVQNAVPVLKKREDKFKAELERMCRGTDEYAWIKEEPGMGKATFLLMGAMPIQPGEHYTVSGLRKRCGLHVHDGAAVRRERGAGGRGKHQHFDHMLRAIAIVRVGMPHTKVACVCKHPKTAGKSGPGHGPDGNDTCQYDDCNCARFLYSSAYGRLFVDRKEATLETHPPMLPEGSGCEVCDLAYERSRKKRGNSNQQRKRMVPGRDCANLGGIHWTDGHRQADALRVLTKAVLRDLWRVQRGMDPREGRT